MTPNRSGGSALPAVEDHPNISWSEVQEKPWKYTGYKAFSRFVGSSRSFFITRQFRTLNARVILAMQDQLAELEEELNSIDDQLSCKHAADTHNGSFREESQRERLALIWTIQQKLKDYNEYVQSYSLVGNRSAVSTIDIKSLHNWSNNNPTAILDAELEYLNTGDDLVYVNPQPQRPLAKFYESYQRIGLKLFRRHPTDRVGYDPETTLLQDHERAEKVMKWIILVVGLAMLIGPLWILEFAQGTVPRLAVITGFVVGFMGLLAFATEARPFESLAATAAYSAVLMVFLQFSH